MIKEEDVRQMLRELYGDYFIEGFSNCEDFQSYAYAQYILKAWEEKNKPPYVITQEEVDKMKLGDDE